jgi:hypothetical protein
LRAVSGTLPGAAPCSTCKSGSMGSFFTCAAGYNIAAMRCPFTTL